MFTTVAIAIAALAGAGSCLWFVRRKGVPQGAAGPLLSAEPGAAQYHLEVERLHLKERRELREEIGEHHERERELHLKIVDILTQQNSAILQALGRLDNIAAQLQLPDTQSLQASPCSTEKLLGEPGGNGRPEKKSGWRKLLCM